MLFEVKDFTKRIHWWVRLFGVVWLVSVALAVVAGVIVGIAAARTEDSLSSSPYGACRAAGFSITYCLQNAD